MGRTDAARGAVFLGPVEISGYYGNLERGLLEIGVDARLVTLFPNPFGYPQARTNPWPAAWAHRIVLRHRRAAGAARILLGAAFVAASVLLLLWTLPRYRSYVFAWGMTILPRGADLPLLRLLGKNIVVVVGHGSEARPPYMSTLPLDGSPKDPRTIDALVAATRAMAGRLARIERWADRVVGLPTTAQLLRRPFIDFYAVGIPTVVGVAGIDRDAVVGESADDAFTVLHVPSKPEVKGTATIRSIMAELGARHPQLRYVEVTGRPHDEVLDALSRADLVVDQLWSDIPMAVVGTEAAAVGRPTVISGYAWDVWRRLLPPEAWPPGYVCDPEELADAIERRLLDRAATAETGRRARDFVEERWGTAQVASRFLRVIDGDPENDWIVDPADIDYGLGCGIDAGRVRQVVAGIVERHGWSALRWARARDVYEEPVS